MKKYHILRTTLAIAMLAGLLNTTQLHAQKPGLITNEITALTADSLTMHGWITCTPDRPRAPLIVCLPMMGQDHSSYDDFVQAVVEKALLTKTPVPYILTVDLRGHGKSVQRGNEKLSAPGMPIEEFTNYPADVAWLIHAVTRDTAYHVDSTNIIIVGASIGANTVPWAAQGVPGVTKIVLLSPGEDYRGVKPAEAVKTFKGKILLVVAEKDEYAFHTVTKLAKANPSAQVLTYTDDRHGTRLINDIPAAMSSVVSWVMKE